MGHGFPTIFRNQSTHSKTPEYPAASSHSHAISGGRHRCKWSSHPKTHLTLIESGYRHPQAETPTGEIWQAQTKKHCVAERFNSRELILSSTTSFIAAPTSPYIRRSLASSTSTPIFTKTPPKTKCSRGCV